MDRNKSNNSNSLINPGNIENQDDSKMSFDINNKRLIKQTLLKEKIKEKNDTNAEKIFKLYKDECDKISDEINNEDQLYNIFFNKGFSEVEKENIRNKISERLFGELMDYSNLYIIFKELKLLELLIFKPDNIDFFNEYKNKIIDFNKLMILIENEKIKNKIFSSRLYKEYAISKCII